MGPSYRGTETFHINMICHPLIELQFDGLLPVGGDERAVSDSRSKFTNPQGYRGVYMARTERSPFAFDMLRCLLRNTVLRAENGAVKLIAAKWLAATWFTTSWLCCNFAFCTSRIIKAVFSAERGEAR